MNNGQTKIRLVEMIGKVIASVVFKSLQIMKHGKCIIDRRFLFVDKTGVIEIRLY